MYLSEETLNLIFMSILNLGKNAIGSMATAPFYKGGEISETPLVFTKVIKIPTDVYVLSNDGKTLARWYDDTTKVLDMEADPVLKNVEIIGREVFENHPNLKKIILPKGLKEIGFRAFRGTKIEEVILPEGLENIGVSSFTQSLIKEINLVENVKLIGGHFIHDTEIKTLQIPEKTYVGGASMNNANLETLILDTATPPNTFVDRTVFRELRDIFVPEDSVPVYQKHWDWAKMADLIRGK